MSRHGQTNEAGQSSDIKRTMRDVVVGRNSEVWRKLSRREGMAHRVSHAIGHRDLPTFKFAPSDRVWVLSYSRQPQENTALLERLRAAGLDDVIYVSSSATVIGGLTGCYRYPRVKWLAEADARRLLDARILTIGLVYDDPEELPAGNNIATACDDLADFMLEPNWPDDEGRRKYLFRVVRRPFGSSAERILYRLYGQLITAARSRPCLLRPIDVLLRALRIRWYGYVYLSNRTWISMKS
jgi:hypothetical protein